MPVMPPSQFDDLFPDDDDEEDDTDESVADDGEQEQEYDGEEELDPRLKKIIMVSSIAIAVVLAILAILLIGKIAGWNILGGKGKTEESTDVITTEGSNDTTAQETVPMVNVVGLYKTAAEEQMKKNGFTNYTFVEKTDATVEKGYVISQLSLIHI